MTIQLAARTHQRGPVTAAKDALRLHLLSTHGDLNGLTDSDALAGERHDSEHPSCKATAAWDELTAWQIVDDVPQDCGRDVLRSDLATVLCRFDTAGAWS